MKHQEKISIHLYQLDLGCGRVKHKGAIGIDIHPYPEVDVVYDLNKGIPAQDNSVDIIYCRHFMEHIEDVFKFISEIHRVLKKGGIARIEVPFYTSNLAFSTLDHKHFFNYKSFDIYQSKHTKHMQVKETFKINDKYLLWQAWFRSPIMNNIVFVPNEIIKALSRKVILVLIYQKYFAWVFPCDCIYFELEKV